MFVKKCVIIEKERSLKEDFPMNNLGDLGINTDVVEKIVEVAVLEIDGVAALSNKSLDITGAINTGKVLKGVSVVSKNGSVDINVYITVKEGFKVKTVAEAVQANVKDRVQDMTGNAITRVNVFIADMVLNEAE